MTALLLLLAALPAAAQTTARLHGRVLAADDRSPLSGALVELVSDDGRVWARGLTGPGGSFVLRAPGGAYRVTVGMLGYAGVESDPVELPPGGSAVLEVVVPLEPIRLEGITASTDLRCGRPRGGDLVRVWEQARRVLHAVDLTDRERVLAFRLAITERDVDPGGGRVLRTRTRVRRAWTAQPFRSAPTEELLADGFIRSAADTLIYLAPDAEALLSDAFLDRYCFSVREGEDGEVGLAFEPASSARDRPQIEGVLWVDAAGRGLRRLEYGYVDAPVRGGRGVPGGEVHYLGLPDGAWIVERWVIRMPVPFLEGGVPTGRVAAVHETGGEVVSVRGPGFRIRPNEPPGAIEGRVTDRATTRPLARVRVYLDGTRHADTTAADGSFRIADVRPGRYRLRWRHPSLPEDSTAAITVEVPAGGAVRRDLALPVPGGAAEPDSAGYPRTHSPCPLPRDQHPEEAWT